MLDLENTYKSGEKPEKAVVFLHGYGADGADLLSMVPLMASDLPNTLFYAPNAPYEMGYGSYKWFEIEGLESPSVFERFGYLDELAKRARKEVFIVHEVLKEIYLTYGIKTEKISIVGFSQGGLLGVLSALTYSEKINSVAGCSAVPLVLGEAFQPQEVLNRMPVFLSHGTADDVVPFVGFEIMQNTLKNMDLKLTTHIVDGMGHGIDTTTQGSLTDFLKKNLGQ